MKPQKALHMYQQLEKANPKLRGKEFAAFEKYDGWYGYWDVGSQIMSRQMRAIPSLEWLSVELNKYASQLPNGRLIFEILVAGVPVFKDLNGILNRKEPAKDAYLVAHDFVYDESLPFKDRLSDLRHVLTHLPIGLVMQAPVLATAMFDEDTFQTLAEQKWAEGSEGIVLKNLHAPYSSGKRNADILKIKMECSEEMLVTGVNVGQGKYSATLGYLLVVDKHGVTHKVSGMNDYERDHWWQHPDWIIDKVVEVQFMQRLANGSLREPRFKAVRHDKTKEELG